MQGDDIVAISVDENPPRLLKGEAKKSTESH